MNELFGGLDGNVQETKPKKESKKRIIKKMIKTFLIN
jgi:hypothetical protein